MSLNVSSIDVVHTIKKHAFETSPYPIILFIENDCGKKQQQRMASILNNAFGSNLVRTEDFGSNDKKELPSPDELMYKVVVCGTRDTEEIEDPGKSDDEEDGNKKKDASEKQQEKEDDHSKEKEDEMNADDSGEDKDEKDTKENDKRATVIAKSLSNKMFLTANSDTIPNPLNSSHIQSDVLSHLSEDVAIPSARVMQKRTFWAQHNIKHLRFVQYSVSV